MTVNLLRMAVGIDDIDHLRRVQADRRNGRQDGLLYTYTRNTPKRAEELTDGGSIYWIIKGYIRVRQRILDVERLTDEEGRFFCALGLDPELVPTVLQARRPQQGWRYLDPADAPADRPAGSTVDEEMPAELAAKLRELGLI